MRKEGTDDRMSIHFSTARPLRIPTTLKFTNWAILSQLRTVAYSFTTLADNFLRLLTAFVMLLID
jgi:hypothetical protein